MLIGCLGADTALSRVISRMMMELRWIRGVGPLSCRQSYQPCLPRWFTTALRGARQQISSALVCQLSQHGPDHGPTTTLPRLRWKFKTTGECNVFMHAFTLRTYGSQHTSVS
jgi:hypothetical protein